MSDQVVIKYSNSGDSQAAYSSVCQYFAVFMVIQVCVCVCFPLSSVY